MLAKLFCFMLFSIPDHHWGEGGLRMEQDTKSVCQEQANFLASGRLMVQCRRPETEKAGQQRC